MILDKDSWSFLETLLITPSPTGYEAEGQKVWKEYISKFSDNVESDAYGSAIAKLDVNADVITVMLEAHADRFNPAALESLSIGGISYGVPNMMNAHFVMVWEPAFTEAGIDVPEQREPRPVDEVEVELRVLERMLHDASEQLERLKTLVREARETEDSASEF
jgi:ABC-type glycerol-3-phosphate transport system substrate-binding protein